MSEIVETADVPACASCHKLIFDDVTNYRYLCATCAKHSLAITADQLKIARALDREKVDGMASLLHTTLCHPQMGPKECRLNVSVVRSHLLEIFQEPEPNVDSKLSTINHPHSRFTPQFQADGSPEGGITKNEGIECEHCNVHISGSRCCECGAVKP